MSCPPAVRRVWDKLRRWLAQTTEPGILFPTLALVVLAVIWGAVFSLVRADFANARQATAVSTMDIAQTYEAQMLRSLRDIDQTLRFVRYAYEIRGGASSLTELQDRDLLPPALLFDVSITDSQRRIVVSTRNDAVGEVLSGDPLPMHDSAGSLHVGHPHQDPVSGEWIVHFSRVLTTDQGAISGLVVVSVDPAFFVSGYEAETKGEEGVVGILGTDGVFMVRRSGDDTYFGDEVDYALVVSDGQPADARARLLNSPWDGVERYMVVRELFALPLAIVVGLSEHEQLDVARLARRQHLWTGIAASVLALLVLAALGGLSRQLHESRAQAMREQVEHAERVEHLAYHDSLTGLPNRRLFSMLLTQELTQAHRHGRSLAVLYLDLDNFKPVNDTFGHDGGDQLLKEIARRIRQSLRESDTVARLGGDEFVALLPAMSDENHLAAVAEKLRAAVSRPLTLADREMQITMSIGISRYPTDGADGPTLMKQADIAMYNLKTEGKDGYKLYAEHMSAHWHDRLPLPVRLQEDS